MRAYLTVVGTPTHLQNSTLFGFHVNQILVPTSTLVHFVWAVGVGETRARLPLGTSTQGPVQIEFRVLEQKAITQKSHKDQLKVQTVQNCPNMIHVKTQQTSLPLVH